MDELPSYPGMPRWVKISAVIASMLVLLLVIVLVFGGGQHGPGRHCQSGNAGRTPPASAVDGAVSAKP